MAGTLRSQITDRWALYNADAMDVMAEMPDESIHASVYSPPFAGLYHYSSSERDVSNARDYDEFRAHYGMFVAEVHRLTKPGRISAVHAAPIPSSNTGKSDSLFDFPGDVIRLHEDHGWEWVSRHVIWKEPLAVRLRTMQKNLAHQTIVEDGAAGGVASADELLLFRKRGGDPLPVRHPTGLDFYAGSEQPPSDLLRFQGWDGKQTENRYSQWVWRRYASSVWDDIRLDRVLPFRDSKDPDDEKHVHPLQLDVIARFVQLRTEPGEVVLTPFMGVGSEVYESVRLGRIGIGVELKPSYYEQAVRNLAAVDTDSQEMQGDLLAESVEGLA
jgi:DNA modification methylase